MTAAVRAPVRPRGDGQLFVVVVAYGQGELLRPALSRLGGRYPVLVVDNSSLPGTRALAEGLGAVYLDPGRNLGFAGAVNRALLQRPAGADVLLLNPDATIEPAAVEQLREALGAEPGAACVAPAQHAPGSQQRDRVCWPFPSPGRAWLEAFGLASLGARDDFLIGSVLLLRGEAIEDVGPFDEGYFLYAEEADWQLRARRRGWVVRYCPGVEAEHEGAGTGGDPTRRERLFHRSQARFVHKWRGLAATRSFCLAQAVGALARAALLPAHGRSLARRRAGTYLRCLASPPPVAPPGACGARQGPSRSVVQVVCTDAFAGVERYVVSLSTGLTARGWQVVVLGGDPAQMAAELAPAGVAWYPARTPLEAAARLWRLGGADLVHAHMTEAELAAALAAPRQRAPIVATRHFARRRGSSPAARAAAHLAARLVREQLAISDFVAGAVEGSSVVVRPGVASVPTPPEAGRRPVVLMVQRLEAEKEVQVGIEAFARSGLARQGWRLEIAGGGAEEPALRDLAGRLGLGGACVFLGRRSDVDSLYASGAIFLASRGDEPYGISVLEAMAHALPVVAAGGGGHLETVGRCPEACLFTPGAPAEAAAELTRLAASPELRARYGAALQAIQRQHFGVDRQVAETIAVYEGLLR